MPAVQDKLRREPANARAKQRATRTYPRTVALHNDRVLFTWRRLTRSEQLRPDRFSSGGLNGLCDFLVFLIVVVDLERHQLGAACHVVSCRRRVWRVRSGASLRRGEPARQHGVSEAVAKRAAGVAPSSALPRRELHRQLRRRHRCRRRSAQTSEAQRCLPRWLAATDQPGAAPRRLRTCWNTESRCSARRCECACAPAGQQRQQRPADGPGPASAKRCARSTALTDDAPRRPSR